MERETMHKLMEYYLPSISALKSNVFFAEQITEKQMNHILNTYGKNISAEDVLGLIDFTVTNNAKDGMVFTTEGIYYKEIGQKPNYILFQDILKVEINDYGKKDCDYELMFYCNDEGTWDDQIKTEFLNKTPLAELLEEIAEENNQQFEIVLSSDDWVDDDIDDEDEALDRKSKTEDTTKTNGFLNRLNRKIEDVREDEEKAEKSEKEEKSEDILKDVKMIAANGEAEAQYLLGRCYEEGIHTEKDERLAVYWYTKATIQHYGEAMCRLAGCYYTGKYVYEDEALAEALLLVSNARESASDKLLKWFDIDLAKDGSFTHHDSIVEAVETVNEFIENAEIDVLEMIEDEIIDEEDVDDGDDSEEYYPKPNKYLLPSTNVELVLGNIRRKLKL